MKAKITKAWNLLFLHLLAILGLTAPPSFSYGQISCDQVFLETSVSERDTEVTPPLLSQLDRIFTSTSYGISSEVATTLRSRSQGPQKIRVLTKLGFTFQLSAQRLVTKAPTWSEFAKNYKSVMDELKVPESKRLAPAVVLYRDVAEGQREYKLINPLKESFPAEAEGFKNLPIRIEFNIPFKIIMQGLREGKFPLMTASHDMFHFIAFAMHPWFAEALVSAARGIRDEQITPAFKRRLFWMMEFTSVIKSGDVGRLDLKHDDVKALRKDLDILFGKTLLERARQVGVIFESALNDVSGATTLDREFASMISARFAAKENQIFKPSSVEPSQARVSRLIEMAKLYNSEISIKVSGSNLQRETSNEIISFNLKTLWYVQSELRRALEKSDQELAQQMALKGGPSFPEDVLIQTPEGPVLGPQARTYLESYLKDLTARMQFAMLAFKDPGSSEKFVQEMLSPDPSPTGFAANILREIFNFSIIQDRFFKGTD